MDLFNIKIKDRPEFTSEKMKIEMPKIQWVSEPNVKIKVVMPDGRIKEAVAEPEIRNIRTDDLIQLVRIGFCRCDKKTDDELVLCFAHK